MEFKDYLLIVRRRFGWFFFCFVGMLLIGIGIYSLTTVPIYKAEGTITCRSYLYDLNLGALSEKSPMDISRYSCSQRFLLQKSPPMMKRYARYYLAERLAGPLSNSIPAWTEGHRQPLFSSLKQADDLVRRSGESPKKILDLQRQFQEALSFDLQEGSPEAHYPVRMILVQVQSRQKSQVLPMLSVVLDVAYLQGLEEAQYHTHALLDYTRNVMAQKQKKIQALGKTLPPPYLFLDRILEGLKSSLFELVQSQFQSRERIHQLQENLDKILKKSPAFSHLSISLQKGSEPPSPEFFIQKIHHLEEEREASSRKLKELSQTETQFHPAVQAEKLHEILVGLELEKAKKELKIASYQSLLFEKESLQQKVQSNQTLLEWKKKELKKLEEKAVHYNQVKDQVSTLRQAMDQMSQIQQKAHIILSLKEGFVDLPDFFPVEPQLVERKGISLPLWFVLALVGGLTGAFLRDHLDNAIVTEYDVRRHLNWKMLSIFPKVPTGRGKLTLSALSSSPLFEIFHTLSTIVTSLAPPRGRTLCITSALQGDGKSLIASNLALALSQEGFQTLLIDGDLRAPSLAHLFSTDKPAGYNQVVAQNPSLSLEQFQALVQKTPYPNLFCLLPKGPYFNPIQVFQQPSWKTLLTYARTQYDYILLDTPPVLSVSDALLISKETDYTLFVIYSGKAERKSLTWAKHLLEMVSPKVLGVVLNGAPTLGGEYYYYYHYRYGPSRKESPSV